MKRITENLFSVKTGHKRNENDGATQISSPLAVGGPFQSTPDFFPTIKIGRNYFPAYEPLVRLHR